MGTRDERIDAYIAKSADFAKPILIKIREMLHELCPDVEETIRWGMPSFTYHGILCNMAAFKEHATLGFWKGSLVIDTPSDEQAMGQFGRLTSVSDLPAKADFKRFVKRAMALNEEGVTVKRPTKASAKKIPPMPDYFMAAIRKNKLAIEGYASLTPSQQREYVEWITEAKGEATRGRRLAQAVEWIAEGKPRNWKYMR